MMAVLDLFQMITLLLIQSDVNVDDIKIQIRELRTNILSNAFSREIVVKGNRQPKIVTATKFTSRCHYGGRAATLKVFINGIDSGMCLLPSDFVDHVKIIFNVKADPGGELRLTSIDGVLAETSDAFSSLGVFNIFGRNAYEGRPLTCIHRE